MKYREAIIEAMNWLGNQPNTVFLGQAVKVSGHALSSTLVNVPLEKRIELPVFEETQMGMSTGLALEGFVPITCYPRFDFFILAMNQLVNHLDKMNEMSKGILTPKVIIRVGIGAKTPLHSGPQHSQNHTEAIKQMLTDVDVIELIEPDQAIPAYQHAYLRSDNKSTLVIEHTEYYNTK